MTGTLPKGFTCVCGTEHRFPAWVYAHWDEPLTFECPDCKRSYSIVQGYAALLTHRAATFDGKRLLLPSTCELHPKYQALRLPRSKKAGCTCAEIYKRRISI